jgi:FKBP-type peptidyl-prolyl cis-trans isomerase FklB
MKRMLAILLVAGASVSCPLSASPADAPAVPMSDAAKDSYSLGYEFAEKIRSGEVPVEPEVVIQAVRDALEGKPPAIGREELQATVAQLRKKAFVLQNLRAQERAAKSLAEAKAFLEKNQSQDGVATLPSGLEYKVVKEGQGQSPTQGDRVTVHYRGTLLDGTEFDNSHARGEPATIPVGAVIRGWTEALKIMKPGSTWRLFVPPNLGYGERPFGRIPANSLLIFDLELISVEKGLGSPGPAQGRSRDGNLPTN